MRAARAARLFFPYSTNHIITCSAVVAVAAAVLSLKTNLLKMENADK